MVTTQAHLDRLASLFRTLQDETRLRVLMLLAAGERNVTDLCRSCGGARPAVSHHLGLLRAAGLVATRRVGRQIFYRLAPRVEAGAGGLNIGLDDMSIRISGVAFGPSPAGGAPG